MRGYHVETELPGVLNTYEKLDSALKAEYGKDCGLESQLGITSQDEFESYIGSWIRFTKGTTQIWVEEL